MNTHRLAHRKPTAGSCDGTGSRPRAFGSIHILLAVFACLVCAKTSVLSLATPAPYPPGEKSIWAPAAKDFLGTSCSAASKVYFTGAEGIITEVFYPSPDTIQNADLQFLVVGAGKTATAEEAEERRQVQHDVSLLNKRAMIWQVTTRANNGQWKLTKRVFTDPGRDVLIVRVVFEVLAPGKMVKDFDLYVLSNPAINNTGDNDNSRTTVLGRRTFLSASEPNSTSSALAVSLPWKTDGLGLCVSHGFVGRNDGWTDLFGGSNDRTMDARFEAAYAGNVAQIGLIDTGGAAGRSIAFDLVLGFGGDESSAMSAAAATLADNLDTLELTYTQQWQIYTAGLNHQNGAVDDQYYLAAMTLRSSQDKVNGAIVAGLCVPWGTSCGDGNRGGYHLVWARDLFKFASALIAAGDTASANNAVNYLFNLQMQADGRFPQNSFVDGHPYWNGTQMDESAMPIILAWKLDRLDLWDKVKKAADFVAAHGPATGQERWEEMPGFSPSTIAAEIAGLICAADLAEKTNHKADAERYLAVADAWRNNVSNWTFTTSGFHADASKGENGCYYIRINANQDPNDNVPVSLGNRTGTHGERYIIDGGFLELVRMGVLSASDWTILETLPEYDAILRQVVPGKGPAWFRYNYDGYGEHCDGRAFDVTGAGRLWPIFTAERGIYEIERTHSAAAGQPYLTALKAFSSATGFIPEQVWNMSATITGWETLTPAQFTPGTATGSAQPLNWAMGEYINLVTAINQGHSDAPAVVKQRYMSDLPQVAVTFKVHAPTQWGQDVYLVGDRPLLGHWDKSAGIKMQPTAYPVWSVTVSLPANTSFQYKFVKRGGPSEDLWDGNANRNYTTPASGSDVRSDTFM